MSSPTRMTGNISIEHNVNFIVKIVIIKTVHTFCIMLQQHDPEGAPDLKIACNYEWKM